LPRKPQTRPATRTVVLVRGTVVQLYSVLYSVCRLWPAKRSTETRTTIACSFVLEKYTVARGARAGGQKLHRCSSPYTQCREGRRRLAPVCGDEGAAAAALVGAGEPPGGRAPTRRSRRRPLNHGLSAISNKTRETCSAAAKGCCPRFAFLTAQIRPNPAVQRT
jgi:hypothetical protein